MSHRIGTATNYLDLLDQLDNFLTATGHAWGKTYSGVGNGDLVGYIGTANSVAETFTLTAINASTFSVVGSVSGTLPNATVNTPYTSAVINFTITSGSTNYTAGDVFRINTSPKWARLRAAGSADPTKRSSDLAGVENLFDGSAAAAGRSGAKNCYVEWIMQHATEVREIVLQCVTSNDQSPRDFALLWRDNPGDPWTTAQSWTGQTWSNNNEAKQLTLSSAPGAHLYWRFQVTNTNGATNGVQIAELHLRERAGASYRVDANAEFVWEAPGLDGTKKILVGLETFGSPAADVYNLGFAGFRAFDNTKSILAQPNGITPRYLSLVNSPIGFWLVANGQRFILVTKAAGVYQTAYCGFGYPYEPPSVHAYPEIIGASGDSRSRRYNDTSVGFRHPMDPGEHGLAVFYPDSQWRAHANRRQTVGGADDIGSNVSGKVWPGAINFSATMPTFYRDNLDGSRALLPGVLWHNSSPRHVWGEFDGYFWISGFGTVAEAIIRQQNFDHLVVNNIFRTGIQHYAAVRLD